MSKRALCATSTLSPAKARNRRTAAATGGARRSSFVAEPGQRGDRRLQSLPRGSRASRSARSARGARPERRRTRTDAPIRAAGRSSRGRRRRRSPPRAAAARPARRRARQVARPAQPRIARDRLVEQRPREPDGNGAPELQHGPCGLIGGNRAAAVLDELDEPVGGIEAELHAVMLVRTYVRVQSSPAAGRAR